MAKRFDLKKILAPVGDGSELLGRKTQDNGCQSEDSMAHRLTWLHSNSGQTAFCSKIAAAELSSGCVRLCEHRCPHGQQLFAGAGDPDSKPGFGFWSGLAHAGRRRSRRTMRRKCPDADCRASILSVDQAR